MLLDYGGSSIMIYTAVMQWHGRRLWHILGGASSFYCNLIQCQ